MSRNLHSLCKTQKETRRRTAQSCTIYSGSKVTVAYLLLGSQKWFSTYCLLSEKRFREPFFGGEQESKKQTNKKNQKKDTLLSK